MNLLLQKHGLPEEGDLVMCNVSKIHFHSIFVDIFEYGRQQGMIHISEVSPGRIRTIRDFVKEGRTVVCKVLRINKERGHVDLSLRRVTEAQRRNKVNELKQEQVAEKIIEHIAKEKKLDVKKFFKEVYEKLTVQYNSIFDAFYDVVETDAKLVDQGLDKATAEAMEVIIRQRIKETSVEIKGKFLIQSYLPDGVDKIKTAFSAASKVKGDYRISYKGAGVFDVAITDKEYKLAEKVLSDIRAKVEKGLDLPETTVEFLRT
jgi:translation initiation factor 2 subunit 1